MQTSWETNHEIISFSLVSDTDVGKTCLFNVKLKLLMNNFLIFLGFMNTFPEAVIRRCSSK